jgi:hypothetical protein
MRNRIFTFIGLLVFGSLSIFGGALFGNNHGRTEMRNTMIQHDFAWTYQSLQEKNLTPQLREYVKAKLYHNSTQVSGSYLRSLPHADQGPVDTAILAGIRATQPKADDPSEYYGWFKARQKSKL